MSIFVPGGPPRFRHQQQGLRDIITNRGIHALLFDPGTGKTATALDYASLLALKADRPARVLVLGPIAAIDTWVDQAPEFVSAPVTVHAEVLGGSIRQKAEALAARREGDYKTGLRRSPAAAFRNGYEENSRLDLISMNLDVLSSRQTVSGRSSVTLADVIVRGIQAFEPDLVIVDEMHRLKGHTSNTSRAATRIVRFAPRRLGLTGTVMPHSPMDVFGQWRFIDAGAFGSSFGRFKDRYAKMGGFMGREIVGYHNLDELQDIMAKRSTVARKEEVLDLPPVTDTVVRVDLSPAEAKAYKEMKEGMATQLASGELTSAPNRLAAMMRLRQITSGYLPDDQGNVKVLGQSKVKVIRSLAHDTLAGEKRIVVFAHFRPEIDALVAALTLPGTEVIPVTGETPQGERLAIRKRFGSDDPARIILVAQIRTMNLGVNELVTASHAIFASLPQQRDDIEQARDRLDRKGQTRPVTIWTAAVPNSIDIAILKAYRERTSVEDAVLRHISSQG